MKRGGRETTYMRWRAVPACCPGDYTRLMGYCYGAWEIRCTISFCCFSKLKETPLSEKQKIMTLQWYPTLRLNGSWQVPSLVWTGLNVIQPLCLASTQQSVHGVSILMYSECVLFMRHCQMHGGWLLSFQSNTAVSLSYSTISTFILWRYWSVRVLPKWQKWCMSMHTWVFRVLAVRDVLHIIIRHLHLLLSSDAHQLLIVHVSNLLQNTMNRGAG